MQGAEGTAGGAAAEQLKLPEDGVTKLIRTISEGFQAHPLEIVLFFLLLAGFVTALIITGRILRKRERKALIAKSEQAFAALITKHVLNETEADLARRMAKRIDDPARRHLMLTDPHIFNAVLHGMYGQEKIPAATAGSLRKKLGFDKNRPSVPKSTAELQPGTGVRILSGNEVLGTGVVAKVEDDALRITPEGDTAGKIRAGIPIRLLSASRQGIHVFETAVLAVTADSIGVAHAPQTKAFQRRKYFRSPVRIPVFIRPESDTGKPCRTLIRDLSGGGARIDDPGIRPSPGDRLELYFRDNPDRRRPLNAEVVRRSRSGQEETISVRFGAISEVERDRIISFINKKTGIEERHKS